MAARRRERAVARGANDASTVAGRARAGSFGAAASGDGGDAVSPALGLAARLLLILLLVVAPSFGLIDPTDLAVPGISDGSDNGPADDVTRKGPAPIGVAITPQTGEHPVLGSAPYRLLGREITPDPAGRLPSSRSPPPR